MQNNAEKTKINKKGRPFVQFICKTPFFRRSDSPERSSFTGSGRPLWCRFADAAYLNRNSERIPRPPQTFGGPVRHSPVVGCRVFKPAAIFYRVLKMMLYLRCGSDNLNLS